MLIGGTRSESNKTFTHGFFQEGTKATQFKASGNYFMRFLPAFDMDKANTPEFETSYLPYRSKEIGEDWRTKTPGFTGWYFTIQGYTWYGKGNQTLISPLSMYDSMSRNKVGVDPIKDIRTYCEKSDDVSLRSLTEDKSFKERAPAPSTRYFALCNVLLMTDMNTKRTENQVGVFTNAAFNDLKTKLAMRAGRGDEIISRDWEDYLYGDITHPAEGLAATVRETSAESSENIRFAGIHFSDSPGRLEGMQKWDLTDTPDALTNRYDISDPSVSKIWTYDEMLDYVVKDGVIPYNVIEDACAQHAENGIPKPASVTSVGSDYAVPNQVAESSEAVAPQNTLQQTPKAVAVAETPTPAPVPEMVANTSINTDKESTAEQSDSISDADRSRYEELSALFKENPNNIPAEELPEFFDLCAKLGVSPSN
jgi:hypothetical protein